MTAPPKLRNDCFALPQGVDWTPVDVALDRLRTNLSPVVEQKTLDLSQASGCILAADVTAVAANPPFANSAVDGYGFAHSTVDGTKPISLPLIDGRAAAGQAFAGVVPAGSAIRILTGARLPDGVDTVVLQEDVQISDGQVHFDTGLKLNANSRKAGEDVDAGQCLLKAHCKIGPAELAIMAATGVTRVQVFRPLRVGVLSTGDELVTTAAPSGAAQIFDANRPMLLDILSRWGYMPVDLGHVPDDPEAIRRAFDTGADQADAILTTGGASAGDEDHVSKLLTQEATLQTWRVAIKPGRPLALAMWQGVPVFGFPGNPVAAFVCALIFARPALAVLAGANWQTPQGFKVPAAFAKSKKAGRREFLRARMTDQNQVEVFGSEGSGRISGLSWADGLVELDDPAYVINTGDLVTYYPYSSFGI